ncbi:MAG TPA: amidohydrolase family protein [Chryseosolibacter sp.]
MNFLLKDVTWHDGRDNVTGDLRIRKGTIVETGKGLMLKKDEHAEEFTGHFIYPGLVNAHDHLEMNLYPRLGSPPYQNYVEWAKDIYRPAESPIREIEKLDLRTRLLWGGLKNLVGGATTVVHHNPWHRSLGSKDFPVTVQKVGWAHSLAFEKRIASKFPSNVHTPFVVHAAEGIDESARSEIEKLERLDLLKANTVIVHGVGLNHESIEMLTRHRCAVVWCPVSNLFLFHRTAPVGELKQHTPVTLGTDSTLTGSPTLLDEMKAANETHLATAREIFDMVTAKAAEIFRLPPPSISAGNIANVFVAPALKKDYFENLLGLMPADIALVIARGTPELKNMESATRWNFLKNKIRVGDSWKYARMDVDSLKGKIEKQVPLPILEQNPLWRLIAV